MMDMMADVGRGGDLKRKIKDIHWLLVLLLAAIAGVGCAMLYSVAEGNMQPWASRHLVRFLMGLTILFVIAVVDIRFWMKTAYAFYALGLALLVYVEFFGHVGMGAQRWINLGFILLQPSELMKIAVVMALARYFSDKTLDQVSRPLVLLPALVLLALPAALVMLQPDLGTALLLVAGGVSVMVLAGLAWSYLIAAGILGAGAGVFAFYFLLHDYQRNRVLTFLNPERDPLGAGYHILQSKIALGSGGWAGQGFQQGKQSHLDFLPEKHTDFIFTMLAEELGFRGAVGLLGLYAAVAVVCILNALSARNHFGRLLAMGVLVTFLLYIFVNVAMVMGLVPVVGVPLPLVSYGGTSMLTLMLGFGLLMSVHVHRNEEMFAGRGGW